MAAVKVWNQTIDPNQEMAGTLTCVLPLANSPGRWMAVSAAHVLAPLVAGSQQVPNSDDQIAFDAGNGTTFTGKLWYWCDLQRNVDGFTNEFDAALVEVSAPDALALQQALKQPATWDDPGTGTVVFDGVTSAISQGSYRGQHTTAAMDYAVLGGTFSSVSFKDSLQAELPARPGDSGALVTSGGCGVGLLVGSEGELARFLPLAPMLKAYGLAWQHNTAGAAPALLPAPPPAAVVTGDAADTLARTLWGEARGEPLRGIRAIAAVILNRAMRRRPGSLPWWWGSTVVGVCRAPFQFSCWNADDPNRAKLLAVTAADSHFKVCEAVAAEALAGQLSAEQQLGATHYHTKSVRPKWARNKVPCADIGAHLFYNDIE